MFKLFLILDLELINAEAGVSLDELILPEKPKVFLKNAFLHCQEYYYQAVFNLQIEGNPEQEMPTVLEIILEQFNRMNIIDKVTISTCQILPDSLTTENISQHRINQRDLITIGKMDYQFICQWVDSAQIQDDLLKCGFQMLSAKQFVFDDKKIKIKAEIVFDNSNVKATFNLDIGDINSDYDPNENVFFKRQAVTIENVNAFIDLIVETIKNQKQKYIIELEQ